MTGILYCIRIECNAFISIEYTVLVHCARMAQRRRKMHPISIEERLSVSILSRHVALCSAIKGIYQCGERFPNLEI